MKPSALILDTCVLLWILSGDDRIRKNSELMELINKSHRFFSPISIVEIAIKRSIGKLKIKEGYLESIRNSGIQELPFSAEDAIQLEELPEIHKDPFDRMLIACAMNNRFKIITGDTVFKEYNLDLMLV